MSGILPGARISPFVAEWLPRIVAELNGRSGPGRALDLAMGEGRHTIPLAEAGFLTYGVDVAVDRLVNARRALAERGLDVLQWSADLESYPLPAARFDLLCCTRFLLRARWHDLKRCVKPGGFVMYETFMTGQIAPGWGPSSPEHLLHPGELEAAFGGWTVLHSEEVREPAALARLVARKPGG
jgi:2-polyprenyl-3-methyl-5-hydroxy-6-metoxy-1,4-benzoquinol methylase